MFAYLRQGLLLLVALTAGYILGNGPFAEWITDFYHQVGVAWEQERSTRGPGGTVPLLVAGYFLGQGLYLLIRTLRTRLEPLRSRKIERLATWDVSLMVGTRFGLYQYLEHCCRWASEDPTTRTQCLALFKIRGLGSLNEAVGTLITTRLLQRIASELRAASLPASSSTWTRWRTHHFPRQHNPFGGSVPSPRYPARWSGATFALAFRELDAVQVVAIVRDLHSWIGKELESVSTGKALLGLTSVVAVGSPGATGRGLGKVAAAAAAVPHACLRILCDRADVRAPTISNMNDIQHEFVDFEMEVDSTTNSITQSRDWKMLAQNWGPALGCLAAACMIMMLTSGKISTNLSYYPLPDGVTEVQQLDATGVRRVRIDRMPLQDEESTGWRISDALIVQGKMADGPYPVCQIRLTVTNTSRHSYYVSSFDFTAIDSARRRLTFPPTRMLRMKDGIAGRWLRPGDSWTGWLLTSRSDAKVESLIFEPDRFTRMALLPLPAISTTLQP